MLRRSTRSLHRVWTTGQVQRHTSVARHHHRHLTPEVAPAKRFQSLQRVYSLSYLQGSGTTTTPARPRNPFDTSSSRLMK